MSKDNGEAELQLIPARHGTATFVPKGHIIKIINTSGTQVIDTWAFALPDPPVKEDKKEDGKEKKDADKEAQALETVKEESKDEQKEDQAEAPSTPRKERKPSTPAKLQRKPSTPSKLERKPSTPAKLDRTDSNVKEAQKQLEKPKTDPNDKRTPEQRAFDNLMDPKNPQGQKLAEEAIKQAQEANNKKAANDSKEGTQKEKATWSSYIPSVHVPSLRSNKASTESKEAKPEDDKEKSAARSRAWSSYLPSGIGFTSYLPSKSSVTALAGERDPDKSLAQQLYDFSKTPVGAAGLSAATGSGYAGTLYAAYSAYNAMNQPPDGPMEYMSMMHSRAAMLNMRPKPGDTLLSNLREPILTLVEDRSPGIHDTLIAACDPYRYKYLGVEKWEEHGSCAENLVLALKDLNEKGGLKGAKGIGADVTINTVPAPLNLFMNIPWTEDGVLSFDAPKCGKGDYVRFRAERDVVVVMSACPQDILDINAKKPTDAHFLVEAPGDELDKAAAAAASPQGRRQSVRKKSTPKAAEQAGEGKEKTNGIEKGDAPKKKPRKLERRKKD